MRCRRWVRGGLRLSLRNRLALVFFGDHAGRAGRAVPVRRPRAADALRERPARRSSRRDATGALRRDRRGRWGPRSRCQRVQDHVNAAAPGHAATGSRCCSVNQVAGGPRAVVRWPTRAGGRRRRRCPSRSLAARSRRAAWSTGTEQTRAGTVAEAAIPGPAPRPPGGGDRLLRAGLGRSSARVATVRHQILVAGAIALVLALFGGYLVARALGPARQAARAGCRAGRGRRLLGPHPDRLGRRAGAAGGGVQPDAAPAGPARVGAQEVHRHRVARAAHPDLLARRLRRAARGRGSRPGDPTAIPGAGSRSGGATAASCRSTCSICPGWSRGRSSCAPSRSTSAS